MMTNMQKNCLEYVKNTNGGATPETFWDDWAPVGKNLYYEIYTAGWIELNDQGRVILTSAGEEKLK